MATIKFQRKGQSAKTILNAVNFNGFLTTSHQVGVGEGSEKGALIDGEGNTWKEYEKYITCLKPYYDSSKLNQEQINYLKEKNYADVNMAIADGWSDYLIRYEGTGEYVIIDTEAESKKEEAEYFKMVLNKQSAIEFGSNEFGVFLKKKIPDSIFAQIKAHGRYWSAEAIEDWFEDMDEFGMSGSSRQYAGWYFNKNVFEVLDILGYDYIKPVKNK